MVLYGISLFVAFFEGVTAGNCQVPTVIAEVQRGNTRRVATSNRQFPNRMKMTVWCTL